MSLRTLLDISQGGPERTVATFWAQIYVGSMVHDTKEIIPPSEARDFLQKYVDEVGLCVSFTPTEYIYTGGSEPGFVVGLINYPRFPAEASKIRRHALKIAEGLRQKMQQFKVTVVFPEETIMVSNAGAFAVEEHE